MIYHDIALIGFGGVNRALAEIIRDRGAALTNDLGFGLRVVAITDLRLGSLMQSGGIHLDSVLEMTGTDTFAEMVGGHAEPRSDYVIRNTTAGIIVEATFTNPIDGEPAISHVRAALESGKSVTTTNKGPVALGGAALNRLAVDNGAHFEYEGSVMSGTPALRLAGETLKGLRITRIEGILNGTSNFVLGRMEEGVSLADAVTGAQALGYAKADPTADIEGSDVRLKVVILGNELLGAQLTSADVLTTGISGITAEKVMAAAAVGVHWKLIGTVSREESGLVTACVRPLALDADHPLAAVSGATNAIALTADLLGTVTISGPGAGRIETAYALLSDIIAIDAHQKFHAGVGH